MSMNVKKKEPKTIPHYKAYRTQDDTAGEIKCKVIYMYAQSASANKATFLNL